MFTEVIRYVTRLAVVIILVLITTVFTAIPVSAQDTLDLVLGGEGSTSWQFDNIIPGDSGTKTVELHNNSDNTCFVSIWINDIVSEEGINQESETGNIEEPGELDKYLRLSVICDRLDTNLHFPVTVWNMPRSVSDTSWLFIHPLDADETINITWKWEFYENGQPQNDAQGDSLSFTINYMSDDLASLPKRGGSGVSAGVGVPERPDRHRLRVDVLGRVTTARITSNGELLEPLIASDSDNQCRLMFQKGTQITSMENETIDELVVTFYQEPRSPPEGTEIIGPVYHVTGFNDGNPVPSIVFSPPIMVTLGYSHDWLPNNATSLSMAAYDNEAKWHILETADSEAESGKVSALLGHTATLAILAELAPEIPAPDEPVPDRGFAPPPANYNPPPSTGEGDAIIESQQNKDMQSIVRPGTGIVEGLKWASLSLAIWGVVAMTILAGIERKRRIKIQD